jgi:hypothetical protein
MGIQSAESNKVISCHATFPALIPSRRLGNFAFRCRGSTVGNKMLTLEPTLVAAVASGRLGAKAFFIAGVAVPLPMATLATRMASVVARGVPLLVLLPVCFVTGMLADPLNFFFFSQQCLHGIFYSVQCSKGDLLLYV